jgi:N-methylhydantoinase A
VNWRVLASGPRPEVRLTLDAPSGGVADALKGERQAYFPELGGYAATSVFDRYRLGPGVEFEGPAIVEERESTVIVGPGAQCHVDDQANLIVRLP